MKSNVTKFKPHLAPKPKPLKKSKAANNVVKLAQIKKNRAQESSRESAERKRAEWEARSPLYREAYMTVIMLESTLKSAKKALAEVEALEMNNTPPPKAA